MVLPTFPAPPATAMVFILDVYRLYDSLISSKSRICSASSAFEGKDFILNSTMETYELFIKHY